MISIKKTVKTIFENWGILLTNISPFLNTKFMYWFFFRKTLNFKKVKTLDEKIQWLKLNTYYNNPLITDCADKYKVRSYVERCGCKEILNELYQACDNIEEIIWDELPKQFVVKWNFGCGQNLICFDKSKLNIEDSRHKLKLWKKEHKWQYKIYAEMQYSKITPKLLCEKFIQTEKNDKLPTDYKLYCFNGVPHCCLVCANRQSAGHADYYFFDKEWNLLRYNKSGLEAQANFTLTKPQNYEILFKYAEILSKPFPFVRCDLYLENGEVIFGELTFTPNAGLDKNRLPSTQLFFGDMIVLDDQND